MGTRITCVNATVYVVSVLCKRTLVLETNFLKSPIKTGGMHVLRLATTMRRAQCCHDVSGGRQLVRQYAVAHAS